MLHTPNERVGIGRRVFAHEIAKEEAAKYIDFFNEARPSFALGYLTPVNKGEALEAEAAGHCRRERRRVTDMHAWSVCFLLTSANVISSFAISPTARVFLLRGNHSRLVGLKVRVHGFPDPEKDKSLRDFLSRKRGPLHLSWCGQQDLNLHGSPNRS